MQAQHHDTLHAAKDWSWGTACSGAGFRLYNEGYHALMQAIGWAGMLMTQQQDDVDKKDDDHQGRLAPPASQPRGPCHPVSYDSVW